ncbi:class I SAM-dependent methyltransferase [Paractinoplanes rhizophilus]|uniref:Class I SAM-dependent methyltransferase n=1 Tax=Paractinoplanes rhizophilus TaxID=1416877 RepID=A0ABW2HVJ4_9ACTN
MTGIFGEVASMYDDVRPGYPDDVREKILDRLGRPPAEVVEIGAGTGKATGLLLGLGAPLTAIEPDPRMAAVLRANFPGAGVAETTFENWTAPPGGVGLIACATAWHWMDPQTRHQRARDALRPDGVLAIFHHRYNYADPAQSAAIDELLMRIDPSVPDKDERWVFDDAVASGVWSDVAEHRFHDRPVFGKPRYLALMQTFSPFRRHAPEIRQEILDGLSAILDDFGGSVTFDLRTTLVLATP